jgi:hypothetical protein
MVARRFGDRLLETANLRNEANKSFVIKGSKFEVVLPFHMPAAQVAAS